ncbi:hypothetical protein Tco_0377727 [Tanacetum coccineum]
MDLMHSTPSMYYEYDAHVKGELLVIMKNSQSVNLLIFISNTLIELFNDFGSDRDGILKRPTMYFNLWRYKVVRHRYSNPMIQPEPEGSTQGYPLVSVEVLRYDKRSKSEIKGRMLVEMEFHMEKHNKGVSYEVSFTLIVLSALRRSDNENMLSTMILITLSVRRDLITYSWNSVKEILLKLNLPDHKSILTDSKDSKTWRLKLKNFKKDATLKLFKSTNQEKYVHVGPKSEVPQDGKVTRWRNEIMIG